jgi:hypothetical protein
MNNHTFYALVMLALPALFDVRTTVARCTGRRAGGNQGFCYSIELLVKAHRLGWKIGEVPVQWFERRHGESRFRVLEWLPAYLRWYGYAFATTLLRWSPGTVALKNT